jgi:VanZ family protein
MQPHNRVRLTGAGVSPIAFASSRGEQTLMSLIERIAALACLLALAVLSLLPSELSFVPSEHHLAGPDFRGHAEHVLAYALTALVVSVVCRNLSHVQLFSALTTWAACLESLQRLSPGRNSDVLDFAFSALGVTIGVALVVIVRKLSKTQTKRT